MTVDIAADEPKAINQLCKAEDYKEAFEIPATEVRPEKYKTYLSIDLASPMSPPILLPNAKILRQAIFKNRVPWILITLFKGSK